MLDHRRLSIIIWQMRFLKLCTMIMLEKSMQPPSLGELSPGILCILKGVMQQENVSKLSSNRQLMISSSIGVKVMFLRWAGGTNAKNSFNSFFIYLISHSQKCVVSSPWINALTCLRNLRASSSRLPHIESIHRVLKSKCWTSRSSPDLEKFH